MKREMDLVRGIAIAVEASSRDFDSDMLKFAGYSDEQIGYHCQLMKEAGLLDAIDLTGFRAKFPRFRITKLTMAGHDFVDAARSEKVWNDCKRVIQDTIGGASIQLIIATLKHYGAAALGVPL